MGVQENSSHRLLSPLPSMIASGLFWAPFILELAVLRRISILEM